MTFREKLLQEHPEKKPLRITEIGCPDDYGYEEKRPCWSKDNGRDYDPCWKCWNRPMLKTNLVIGDSKVEHPDTDIPVFKIGDHPDANGRIFSEGVRLEPSFMQDKDDNLRIKEISLVRDDSPKILDSGNRREFASGAVRDIQEGKGRMDLLPWGAIIEVSKHCENGAKKYGEHNVDKGIPTHSLCDSAARHLAKYLDGWTDEPHLLAAAWNLLWALQMELKHKECVDTPWVKKENNTTSTQQE